MILKLCWEESMFVSGCAGQCVEFSKDKLWKIVTEMSKEVEEL